MGDLFLQVKDNLQFLLVCAAVTAVLIAAARLAERTFLKEKITRISSTRYTAICGVLGALAAIIMLFEFPIPFLAPSFYELDFGELPALVGGFFLGPVGAVVIELVKVLLKLVIKGTSTAFVGDFANFVIGCALVVPASIIYHLRKSKRHAVAGLAAGTVIMAVFGTAFNAFYLLPAFAELFGLPLENIVAMGTAINGNITSVTTLVIFSVFPLNVIKGTMDSVLTMLLYKRISVFLHNMTANDAVGKKAARIK